MRRFRKAVSVVAIVVAVVALGILLGWFGTWHGPPEVTPVTEVTGQTNVASADAGRSLLKAAVQQMQLFARGHHRIQKLARTITDLAGAEAILYWPRRTRRGARS